MLNFFVGASSSSSSSSSKVRKNKKTQRKKKKQPKTEKFENLSCHPIVRPRTVVGKNQKEVTTCYNDETLYKLKDAWNKQNPYQRIHSDNTTTIWKELQHFFRDKCSRESCWLKELDSWIQGVNSNEIIKKTFAPKSPKSWNRDPHEWLSNFDIEAVMHQFEQKFPFFKFIGSAPIDFDKSFDDDDDDDDFQNNNDNKKKRKTNCVDNALCNFNLESHMKKGITKIGFSFNTDPHDKPGEHWISMFVDTKKKFIFFFDSAGDEIPDEIKALKDRIMTQGKILHINFKFDQNHPVDHQLRDSECGVYSLFFMQSLIEETAKPSRFKKNVIRDGEMHKLRKKYFNFKM